MHVLAQPDSETNRKTLAQAMQVAKSRYLYCWEVADAIEEAFKLSTYFTEQKQRMLSADINRSVVNRMLYQAG